MDSIYLLYAALSGMSIYVAMLTLFGRRIDNRNIEIAVANLALAAAFALLAVGRSLLMGIVHGQLAEFTRTAFGIYGICLVVFIGRYWWSAWRAKQSRKREQQSE